MERLGSGTLLNSAIIVSVRWTAVMDIVIM